MECDRYLMTLFKYRLRICGESDCSGEFVTQQTCGNYVTNQGAKHTCSTIPGVGTGTLSKHTVQIGQVWVRSGSDLGESAQKAKSADPQSVERVGTNHMIAQLS